MAIKENNGTQYSPWFQQEMRFVGGLNRGSL